MASEKRGDFPGGISVGEVWVALFFDFSFSFFSSFLTKGCQGYLQ
jgi:hypothetical protein